MCLLIEDGERRVPFTSYDSFETYIPKYYYEDECGRTSGGMLSVVGAILSIQFLPFSFLWEKAHSSIYSNSNYTLQANTLSPTTPSFPLQPPAIVTPKYCAIQRIMIFLHFIYISPFFAIFFLECWKSFILLFHHHQNNI